MYTVNVALWRCPLAQAFALARQVENWPDLLPHYRWVRFHSGDGAAGGLVEMAAQRRLGSLGAWPLWWLSTMTVDPDTPAVRYRHRRGISRGMTVEWRFAPLPGGTRVSVVHRWQQPHLGEWAAHLIGAHFVRPVCAATLTGLGRAAELDLPGRGPGGPTGVGDESVKGRIVEGGESAWQR